MTTEYPKPLNQKSPEELRELLQELEADEARISKLKDENPHIASLRSDAGLQKDEYSIFQSLSVLTSIQSRIKSIREILDK